MKKKMSNVEEEENEIIPIELPSDILLKFAIEAHERDMKLNDYLVMLFMKYAKDLVEDRGESPGIYEETKNTV